MLLAAASISSPWLPPARRLPSINSSIYRGRALYCDSARLANRSSATRIRFHRAAGRGVPEEGFEPFWVGHAVHENFSPNPGSLEVRDVKPPGALLTGARWLSLRKVVRPTQHVEVGPVGAGEHDLLSSAGATQRE